MDQIKEYCLTALFSFLNWVYSEHMTVISYTTEDLDARVWIRYTDRTAFGFTWTSAEDITEEMEGV